MKKVFLIILLFGVILSNAQVGINTRTPVNMLDINGDLNINKEIRMGGSDFVKGKVGAAGDIFHNNADLAVNDWKTIKVADGQGSMALFSMNTVSDKVGATFLGANGSTAPYTDNAVLDATWTVLEGTVDTFSITNATNKVVFTFQTTAQKTGNTNSSASYACGIFVNNSLKAVRTDVLVGGDGTNKIFNLNATLTNLPPQRNYTVKAACTKRNLNSGTLGTGKAVNTSFLNTGMAQSVLTTQVLQPY